MNNVLEQVRRHRQVFGTAVKAQVWDQVHGLVFEPVAPIKFNILDQVFNQLKQEVRDEECM